MGDEMKIVPKSWLTQLADILRETYDTTDSYSRDEIVGHFEELAPFKNIMQALIDRNVTEIVIPEGTESIGSSAFSGCLSLTSITIPDSVTRIGYSAFDNCVNLTSIAIPDSVTSIGDYAFAYCSGLTSVSFGSNLKEIKNNGFANCNKCVTYDFSRCTSIPELTNTNSLTVNTTTKIIVPSFLYNKWIVATNWKEYKDYIVAVDVKAIPNEDNFSIYVDAAALKDTIDANFSNKSLVTGVGNYELRQDGNVPFLRIYGDGSSLETRTSVSNIEGKTTGKYLVFAYRIPTSNAEAHTYLQVYTNTTGDRHSGQGDLIDLASTKDGKWHVVVIDMAEAIESSKAVRNGTCESKFVANADGTYTIQKLRIDWLNRVMSTDSFIDIAYVGTCDTIESARGADANYDGLAILPDDFVDKLDSKAAKSTYNGMEYVSITDKTNAYGEKFVEFYNNESLIKLGTSRFVGILYRNAPAKYGEVYISSSTSLTDIWASNVQETYNTSSGWYYEIYEIPDDGYKDSVCRRLRFDYFNGLTVSTEYSIDIAFLKFFSNEDEADAYYDMYVSKYDL